MFQSFHQLLRSCISGIVLISIRGPADTADTADTGWPGNINDIWGPLHQQALDISQVSLELMLSRILELPFALTAPLILLSSLTFLSSFILFPFSLRMSIERGKSFFEVDEAMTSRENVAIMPHDTDHSPEHYQQMEVNMNVRELTQRVYGKGSENMLSLIKNFWYR